MEKKSARGVLLIALLAMLAFTASAAAEVGTWQIDAQHSAAQFSVRHMMISNVKGEFSKMAGTVQYDPADITKTVVDVTIDANSINTRVEGRDKDLRSANFFDVEKYPTLTFKSKRVQAAGAGKWKITGDLTIHGTTKEVILEGEGPTPAIKDGRGALHMGASGGCKVNRKDFGLTWNRTLDGGGVVVGDEVTITIDVEMVQRPAAPSSN